MSEARMAQTAASAADSGRLIEPGTAGLLLFAVAYFAGATLNAWPDLGPGGALWLPSGPYLAVLLRSDLRRWPLVAAVALVADAAAGSAILNHSFPISVSVALSNAIEALAAAYLLRQFRGTPFVLEAPRDVLALVAFGAILGPAIGATVGAAALAQTGVQAFMAAWPTWWISHALGVLIGVPLVLAALAPQRRGAAEPLPRQVDESARHGVSLYQSASLAQAVVDGLTSHVAILDARGKIIAVNRRWREFAQANLGSPAVVNEGADYVAVCDSAQLTHLANGLRDLLAGERQEMSFEYPCHTPVGARWFVMRAARLPDGGPGRVVVAHDDITGRVLAEQALRESEERLWVAQAAAGLGSYDYDMITGQIRWDETVRRWWGVAAEQNITQEVFLSGLHRDDVAPTLAAFERAADPSGDGRHDVEYRVINRLDGTMRWIASFGQTFCENGRAVRRVGMAQDITARKQAEQALRESEQRLRLARAAAGLGIYDLNIATGAVRWDDRVRELWGVGPNEPITAEFAMAALPEADRATVRAALAKAHDPAGDGRYYADYRVINRRDGVTRWVAASGQTFFDQGRAIRMVGTVQDITARKQAEQALRESEERLSLANAAAGSACFEYNLISGETRWDPLVYEWWGLPQDRPVQQDIVLAGVHPDDLAVLRAAHEKAADPAGDGRYAMEYRVISRRDGRTRWIAGAGRTFFEQGRAVRRLGMLQDVTARKQAEQALRDSEERLQLARAAAEFGVFDHDLVHGTIVWDARAREFWGVEPDETVTRELIRSMVHEDDRAARSAAIARALDPSGDGRYRAEHRIVSRKDGSTRWIAASTQVFFADGKPVRSIGVMRDITARKAAEAALERANAALEERIAERTAALRASEQRLRSLLDLSSDWFWEQDADLRFAEFSAAPLEKLGVRGQSHVGKTRWELPVHGVSEAQWAAHRAQLERRERFRDFEFCWVNEQGETLWVSSSGDPIFDESGRFVGYRGVGRDITARKRAEEELTRAKERLELALQAANNVIFELDLRTDMVVLHGSPRGASTGEIVKVSLAKANESVHPDDLPRLLARIEELRSGAATEMAQEWRIRQQSGAWAWRLYRGRVTQWDPATGQPLLVTGVSMDVSERKRVEQELAESAARLRSLVEMSSDWYWEQDENFRFVGASDALLADSNVSSASINGKTRWELPTIGVSEAQWAAHRAQLERHEPFRDFEFCRLDDLGGTIWISTSGDPIFDESGRFTGYRGVARNITARRRFEEAQAALAQGQRMEAVGQLTGGLAHDMNNLLTVVSGNLELADRRIADEDARDMLRRARDAVTIGANLNRRLLTFARQRRLDPVLLVLNERVTEMAELLRRTLGPPVSLTTRLAEDLWPIRADPGEIDNAVLNLAINARDAMPNGGTLTIATVNATLDDAAVASQPGAQPGDYVCLSVTDTGTGMTREVLRRAVEPFFTTKEVGKGTGLGLSTVYGFAKQSGGFLAIDSELGKGTTVRIHLPRAMEQLTATVSCGADDVPVGAGELVLVVEDNEGVSQVAREHLEGLGYAVLAAGDGPEALRILESGEPVALVFSDVVMPGGMSGYDIVRWVQARKRGIRVLLTSGFDAAAIPDDRDAFRSIKVLAKPYSRAQLARAVRAALSD